MYSKKSNSDLPNDIEKEKFVLGALLLKDGEIIPNVAAISLLMIFTVPNTD